MNTMNTQEKLVCLAQDISLVIVLDLKCANTSLAHRMRIQVENAINASKSFDEDEIESQWRVFAKMFGFELDDDMDDIWMCLRLTILEWAGIDP